MTDDWGRQIAEVRGKVEAHNARIKKVERWVEEDSPRFHEKMNTFVTRYDTLEAERDRVAKARHQENIDRMKSLELRSTIFNLIIATIGLIVAICSIYVSAKVASHTGNLMQLFSQSPAPVVSSNQEISHW